MTDARTPLEEAAAAVPEGIAISPDLPWTDEQVAEFRERLEEVMRQGQFRHPVRSLVDDEPGPSCAGCGSGAQVVWCGAYTAFYCTQCRWEVTERTLAPVSVVPVPPAETSQMKG